MNIKAILFITMISLTASSNSEGGSGEGIPIGSEENLQRTEAIVAEVENYMDEHKILVALLVEKGQDHRR